METRDLELGNVKMIQESIQKILKRGNERKDIYHDQQEISPLISMVPGKLRDQNPSFYKPRVVSIGPLHRDDENVKASEGLKAWYLIKLMDRTKFPQEEILESCMQKVYASMERIKACYVWKKRYPDVEIAEMMVIDACFILEYIRRWSGHSAGRLNIDDVIYDLVLVENQIPFFVLDEIYHCTILKKDPQAKSLIDLFYPLLSSLNLFEAKINTDGISLNTTHHILSLLHQCYKPKPEGGFVFGDDDDMDSVTFPPKIRSVVDLGSAGVKFKPDEDPTWLMRMSVGSYWLPCFSWPWRTLGMPVLYVQDLSESLLRNLIAYEQSSSKIRKYFTSYVFAMDMLVKTQEDVTKLVDSKVIINYVGGITNEEIAQIFNSICKEVAPRDFFYEYEWKELSEYWNSNTATMRRTYFSSPWKIIGLFAGIILFFLTLLQTIFTIKPKK